MSVDELPLRQQLRAVLAGVGQPGSFVGSSSMVAEIPAGRVVGSGIGILIIEEIEVTLGDGRRFVVVATMPEVGRRRWILDWWPV